VRLVAIAVFARAVAHLSDTRGFAAIETDAPPEAARTILIGQIQVKEPD
jgi:hypothetical protein